MRLSTLVLAVSICFAPPSLNTQAKSKKKSLNLLTAKSDSTKTDYAKVTKGGKKDTGLFTVIYNSKSGKLYFELPDSAFSHQYILANRMAATSDTQDFVAGQMINTPLLIQFSKDERNVYINLIQSNNVVDKNDPIAASFDKNFLNPRMKGFKIAARNNGNVVIDVTSFFGTNEAYISPLKEVSVFSKLFGDANAIKGTFSADASSIDFVKTFPKNIEIESTLSFNTTGMIKKPYSVKVHRSLFVLPEDPMPMRYQDNRVGFFNNNKNIYSSSKDKVESKTYINRWRLQPKPEDMDKYFAGELVEPQKPIVFYVDSAFPEKWRETIKTGIEDWNQAFEQAGFKNAIIAKDYPKNDPDFDPDDMRYNCFKYAVTSTANAMGPSHKDPRTGEILTADVIWYHNIVSLLHNWRFIQTAAVDKRVRKNTFDDDVMRESIRYAAAHEIGHTLGLMHNMGASYAFPVDSLRSPSFTQKYGTTPSIMDYARNNYVAQPGDLERGVRMVPPIIGVYDIHAINWGYRLFKDTKTPEDEYKYLNAIIEAKKGDPMYKFGAQQLFLTVDPTDQMEDLGDDHMKANNYGIKNLKKIIANIPQWLGVKNDDYEEIQEMYKACLSQYMRYLTHVMPYLGGVEYTDLVQDGSKEYAKAYIPKAKQKAAMEWLVNQALHCSDIMLPKEIMRVLGIDSNSFDNFQSTIAAKIYSPGAMGGIYEGERSGQKGLYTLDGYLNDAYGIVFRNSIQGKNLTQEDMNLQTTVVLALSKFSNLDPSMSKESPLGGRGLAEKDPDLALSEFMAQATADSHSFCNAGCAASSDEVSYARHNMSGSKLSAGVGRPLITAALKKIHNLYKSRMGSGDARTRAFYEYQVTVLNKLFKK